MTDTPAPLKIGDRIRWRSTFPDASGAAGVVSGVDEELGIVLTDQGSFQIDTVELDPTEETP